MVNANITVVVPLYNKENYIRECIDSILSQTVQPVEIIIVDDGSTDRSFDVVKAYKNPIIRLIRQQNLGEASARNTGALLAKSQYLAFIDADDFWHPNHLKELTSLIEAFPSAILLSTSITGSSNTSGLNYIEDENTLSRQAYYTGTQALLQYAKDLLFFSSSSVCVSASALSVVNGFPLGLRQGPDVVTWIKLCLEGSVAHSRLQSSVYRRNVPGQITTEAAPRVPDHFPIIKKMLFDLRNSLQKRFVKKVFNAIVIRTFAGDKILGNASRMRAIITWLISERLYSLYLVCWFIKLVPNVFLRQLKRS